MIDEEVSNEPLHFFYFSGTDRMNSIELSVALAEFDEI